jgi:acyl-CoA reductase-like NAD-dependent aldehyde dehydrogenase
MLYRRSPVDLRPLSPIRTADLSSLPRRVDRARTAHEVWQRQSFDRRVDALRRAARAMLRDRQRIVDLVRSEVGKSTADGLFTEALGPLETLNQWVGVVEPHVRGTPVRLSPLSFPNKSARLQLVARGVVGIIAPWNFPVAGLYRSTFPALLLGNAIVVKPSEYAPLSSQWFLDHLSAELPPDLVTCVHGRGEAGARVLESGIDACCFTGSVATGRRVEIRCAELGIPCSAELGGNDVAIVLGDCDLPRTVAGLTQWALQNNGQACGAVEVVAVESAVADGLTARLAEAFRKLDQQSLELRSPVANQPQLDRIDAHVKDAVAKGARLVSGGCRSGDGLFYRPTILDRCTEDMAVVQEETFGPVLALVRVPNAYEAVRLVRRSRYGLTASIWTRDLERAERLADRLDVGVVTVNNHALTGAIPQLAWSGVRDSGTGIANSAYALTTLGRPKSVLVDRGTNPEPFWLPYDDDLVELGHRLADAQLGHLLRAVQIPLLLRRRVERIKAFFHWR